MEHDEKYTELKQALLNFQSERMNDRYIDLKSNPEYTEIGGFFFNRIYGPQDFSFRDQSIRQLYHSLEGVLPEAISNAIRQIIEFHELSEILDDQMVQKMMEAGIRTDFDSETYCSIYRLADNFDQRLHQVRLGIGLIETFHGLSQKMLIKVAMAAAKKAANLLGIGEIMEFIDEGYNAFKKIKNIGYFLEQVEKRETDWILSIRNSA